MVQYRITERPVNLFTRSDGAEELSFVLTASQSLSRSPPSLFLPRFLSLSRAFSPSLSISPSRSIPLPRVLCLALPQSLSLPPALSLLTRHSSQFCTSWKQFWARRRQGGLQVGKSIPIAIFAEHNSRRLIGSPSSHNPSFLFFLLGVYNLIRRPHCLLRSRFLLKWIYLTAVKHPFKQEASIPLASWT